MNITTLITYVIFFIMIGCLIYKRNINIHINKNIFKIPKTMDSNVTNDKILLLLSKMYKSNSNKRTSPKNANHINHIPNSESTNHVPNSESTNHTPNSKLASKKPISIKNQYKHIVKKLLNIKPITKLSSKSSYVNKKYNTNNQQSINNDQLLNDDDLPYDIKSTGKRSMKYSCNYIPVI